MLLQTCLFLLVLSNFCMLGTPRIRRMTGMTAIQGLLLTVLLCIFGHVMLAVAVLLIKGLLLPGLLWRTLKRLPAQALVCPRKVVPLDVLAGMGGLAFSFWLDGRLVMAHGLFPPMLLPLGLATLFCGLILIVGRIKAITQVIGYLVAENGIFLLGMPLMTTGTAWFELALLLDVFVAVFVMGIAINHISDSFASIDVARFRSLRD
ncbi:MAG: hydrogenase-4 component E [Desulfovibrio sp.]|nr:hydrogenase-4 component E [Desulfovibrio sp.]